MLSSVGESGTAPPTDTFRWVGRKPTTPHKAAGTRIEPTVSEPIAAAAMPAATDPAAPEDEPPGVR